MSTHYFTGIARWAKVQKPDSKYKYYGLELALDDESLAAFDASGITTIKARDGYHSFKRRPDQVIWVNKQQVKAGPPAVVDSGGNPTREFIGNGSKVTIKVESFPYDNTYGKGVGARLEAVKIIELVRFEEDKPGEEDITEAPRFKAKF